MFWFKRYKERPDLNLSHKLHLEWYEEGSGLERVGSGVEADGALLYRSAS